MNTLTAANRFIMEGHLMKAGCLNNLGNSFESRFQHQGDISDLHKAITVKQQAIRLTPDDHSDKPAHLNNLRVSFQSQFERLGDIADLHNTLTVKQQAVCLTPDDHPHSVEVMVYQYDKLFGYGCWMTSIPTLTHIFIF